MFGDCQVMPSSSSMMLMGSGSGSGAGGAMMGPAGGVLYGGGAGLGGGNMMLLPSAASSSAVLADHFFSSPHRNPNHGLTSFMAGLPPFHSFSAIIPKEENGMMMVMGVGKDAEMESCSAMSGQLDGGSCGEEHDDDILFGTHTPQQNQPRISQPNAQPPPPPQNGGQNKKKRYHRHTAHQIQEMEALFKECPHPDDKQRLKLSQDLGLKPRQVKFWFQNRRTQMKAQQDRADNVMLRAENENLKSENYRLQAAVRNVVCPSCGNPAVLGEVSLDEQHLRLENARLKEELERLSCIVARFSYRSLHPLGPGAAPAGGLFLPPSLDLDIGVYARHFSAPPGMDGCADVMPALATCRAPSVPGLVPAGGISTDVDGGHHQAYLSGGGLFVSDQDKALALDLAMTAAAQLGRMCRENEPLWVRAGGGLLQSEVLDVEEYKRGFPWPVEIKQRQQVGGGEPRLEATRDSSLVIMNSITLVDAFLDVNKWVEMFPSIVSTARTIQVIAAGISGHGGGSLHLMHAEFRFLSPLVPTREAYFFRYCQQNTEEGTWSIVDFPVDGFNDGLQAVSIPRYRRRLSGCLIQDMPNGYSKVSWVELAEVEDKPVHQVFHHLIQDGTAFGAHRWLAVLQRQCERLASLMARNISDLGVIPSPEARRNMMMLSQRMVRTLCSNISASATPSWTALSDAADDTVRITTRKSVEPGQPTGVVLCAVSTTWLPHPHEQVFELLTDEQRRSQLDVLSGGNSLQEVAHIANGSHHRNCVSLLRINASSNSSQNVELVLQESSTHPTNGSLVVYANVDVSGIQLAMSGDDPSCIPLLPVGFVVLPAAAAGAPPPPPPPPGDAAGVSGDNNGAAPRPAGCLLTVGLQVLASSVPTAKLHLSSVNALNNHLCNAVRQIRAVLGGDTSCFEPVAATAATTPVVAEDK